MEVIVSPLQCSNQTTACTSDIWTEKPRYFPSCPPFCYLPKASHQHRLSPPTSLRQYTQEQDQGQGAGSWVRKIPASTLCLISSQRQRHLQPRWGSNAACCGLMDLLLQPCQEELRTCFPCCLCLLCGAQETSFNSHIYYHFNMFKSIPPPFR